MQCSPGTTKRSLKFPSAFVTVYIIIFGLQSMADATFPDTVLFFSLALLLPCVSFLFLFIVVVYQDAFIFFFHFVLVLHSAFPLAFKAALIKE